jgi:chemotaxis protein MotB
MPDDEKLAPIIIIVKKKGGHGGHHGGAWKVAYADFVTAMMALFIVLWLLSSSEQVKKAVGGYFSDPDGSGKMAGSSMAGIGESISLSKDDMDKLKEKLQESLRQLPKFEQIKNQVQMTITGEGLRIELLETSKGMFFESGSSNPSEAGKELLMILAQQLGTLPNNIVIEGHTDSKPFTSGGTYSNWELSTDRANAARRFMSEDGLRPNQVKQVRGFADQQLRNPKDPDAAGNRRVSVIVQYQRSPEPEGDKSEKKETAHGESAPAKSEKKAGSATNEHK